MQALGDFWLEIEIERVGSPSGQIMKVRSQTQKKIVSRLDPSLVRFAQPIFTDQVRRGKRAFFEIGHPEEILIIAQTPAPAFEIWLLHVNAVAKFAVSRFLIAHSQLHILAFRTDHTLGAE